MSRRKVPYGLTFDQNSAVRPRRSSSRELLRPRRFGQDLLQQQGVDVHERGLEQVQREHRRLGVLLVRAGQGAVLAVVEHGVRAVPVLHDLEAAVDLPAQVGAGEVVAGEDGAHGAAEFFEGLVGGVLGAAAGEAPQHLLGLRGAQPQGGGVLDHLVVLLRDQLPADRPGQRGAERRPAGRGVVRAVQADAADVLQPGQQAEVEQLGEREPDDGGAVGVDVVRLDLGVRAVPQQALDHRRDLGRRTGLELGVDADVLPLDVPVDHHAVAAVAGVVLGHEVARTRSRTSSSPTRTPCPAPTRRYRGRRRWRSPASSRRRAGCRR